MTCQIFSSSQHDALVSNLNYSVKETKQTGHLVPYTTNVNELTKAYIKSDHENLDISGHMIEQHLQESTA